MNLRYLEEHWRRVLDLSVEHLQLTLLALALAAVIAVPLGLLVASVPSLTFPVFGLLDVIYTIPSLALLAFLIPSLGLGRTPAVVALAAYAQLALVRNIVVALRGVDRMTLEAARGVGMGRWDVFARVRLPLALPVLIAGVRVAAVGTISLASVTAWINAGGLGTLLFDGINRDYPSMILAGTIAIVALAILVDATLRLAEWATPAARAARSRTG